MILESMRVTRNNNEDSVVPLTHPVLHVRCEKDDLSMEDNPETKLQRSLKETSFFWSWHLWIGFLILISAFILLGICLLSWYYLHSVDLCNPAVIDSTILYSKNSVDPDVDPCDDFYSHVCGRWNISGFKKYRYMSNVEETDVRNLLKLESYLKCSSAKDLTGWSRFMKEMYDSCEEERKTTVWKSEIVRFVKIMAELLLQDDSRVRNLDDVLRQIHHKLLQTGLFSWNIALDLKNGTVIQALRLSPPKTPWNGNLSFFSKYHLMEYIAEILLLLGGDELFILRRSSEIADFIGLLSLHHNATTSKLRQNYFNRRRFTFDELMKEFDFINFAEYFEKVSLPDSVSVVIDEWQYFEWIRNYTRENEENMKMLRNFLLWSAIEFFVPYMPVEFAHIRHKYGQMNRKAKDLVMDGQVCVNAVKKSMNFAASSFLMENILNEESREMVNEIIFHIKNSYKNFLHSLHRLHPDDKKWLTGLERVFRNIEMGVPAHLQKIYNEPLPFTITNKSFPYHLLSAINFSTTKMINYIDKVPLAVLFLSDFLQLNGIFINLPLLIINLGILTPPLFHSKQSLSSNYANLGFVLAHELAHSIDHLAINTSSIQNHLKSVTQCLQKQYGNSQRIIDVTQEDFADNVGIRIAYNAFLDHAARRDSSCTEADKRNFFIHYGQFFCEDGTSFSLDHNAFHSPYKHRVNVPLSNFPDFANLFSCTDSTVMNKGNKCNI